MKRILIALILFISVLISFTACNTGGNTPSETVFDKLNKLAKEEYGSVEISVTTVTGDVSLSSKYIVTNERIEYIVEKMNSIDIGGASALPDEHRSTLSGVAEIKDGKVVKIHGDEVTLPSHDEIAGAFCFDEDNFKDVSLTDGKLSAKIVSLQDFISSEATDIDDAAVVVYYNDNAIMRVDLMYSTSLSMVNIQYLFEA